MTRASGRVLYIAASVTYAGLLTWASLLPMTGHVGAGTMEVVRRWVLNLLHVPAYAVLGFLFCRAMTGRAGLNHVRLVAAGVSAVVLGVVIELLQARVPGRYPDFIDGSLNTVGVVVALWWVWRRNRDKAGVGPARAELGRSTS